MLDLIVIVIVTVLNILLALLVLSRNPKAPLNRLFGAFAISLVAWSLLNYAADFATTYNLLFTRLTFAAVALISASLFSFSNIFPTGVPVVTKRWSRGFNFLGMAIFIALSLSPYVVPSVTKLAVGISFTTGPLYYVYTAFVLLYVFLIMRNFRRQYKRSDAVQRNQIKYMLTGLGLYILLAVLSQLIIPLISDTVLSSRFGPIFTLLFIAFSALAIVRHRLFDIRLIVARSLAYVFALSSLAAVYAAIVVVVTRAIPIPENLHFINEAIPFIAAVLVALSFGPVKRFFDLLTNKFFYQDAYEAQNLLNELNSSLVSTIDLNTILRDTSILIEHYLKPTYVAFYVYTTDDTPSKAFSTTEFKDEKRTAIYKLAQNFSDKVTIISSSINLPNDLQRGAAENDMAMVAKLISPNQKKHQAGAIVLGSKKSGSIYGTQDHRVMEIIADELVIAIQNALRFEEIQQFNVTLQQKVDDATGQLRAANQRLIAIDQTKDDFISMASHQLRTPLTSVKGYVSMVLEGDVGKITKEQRKLLDQAFLSSQRMVYLIADLLNVSRLKTGKFIIEPKPTNLAEVVGSELDQLKETAASRNLEVKYDKPKDFPILPMDETKIRQVVMNFVDNAIYYTPAGGHIQVVVADKGETIEFTVSDDGIGVPKSEQHNLFTKFYRAGNAKKARPDGTGLGLFMAKKVVIAQGGNIIFKTAEGKGSTFGFAFAKKKLSDDTRSVAVGE